MLSCLCLLFDFGGHFSRSFVLAFALDALLGGILAEHLSNFGDLSFNLVDVLVVVLGVFASIDIVKLLVIVSVRLLDDLLLLLLNLLGVFVLGLELAAMELLFTSTSWPGVDLFNLFSYADIS